jgi:hypothetical protein
MAEIDADLAELALLAFGPRSAVAAVALQVERASFATRDRGGEATGFRGSELSAPGLEATG